MSKIVHYCWFGENPKPELILRCIESWKRFFPDWEIKEWNESNFDVHCNTYVEQAYQNKKWAFVSDYCRFWALEKFGGIYFDTDVEVIRSFDDILNLDSFTGFESKEFVAPGLVLYAKKPGNEIIRMAREWYDNHVFLDENGERIRINVCGMFTALLKEYGFIGDGSKQICNNMVIFPEDYFCPFSNATGVLRKTDNTYSIHWYNKSWMDDSKKRRNKVSRIIHRIFGLEFSAKIKNALKKLGIDI